MEGEVRPVTSRFREYTFLAVKFSSQASSSPLLPLRLWLSSTRYDLGEIQVEALKRGTVSIERGEYVALMGPLSSGTRSDNYNLDLKTSITGWVFNFRWALLTNSFGKNF